MAPLDEAELCRTIPDWKQFASLKSKHVPLDTMIQLASERKVIMVSQRGHWQLDSWTLITLTPLQRKFLETLLVLFRFNEFYNFKFESYLPYYFKLEVGSIGSENYDQSCSLFYIILYISIFLVCKCIINILYIIDKQIMDRIILLFI